MGLRTLNTILNLRDFAKEKKILLSYFVLLLYTLFINRFFILTISSSQTHFLDLIFKPFQISLLFLLKTVFISTIHIRNLHLFCFLIYLSDSKDIIVCFFIICLSSIPRGIVLYPRKGMKTKD